MREEIRALPPVAAAVTALGRIVWHARHGEGCYAQSWRATDELAGWTRSITADGLQAVNMIS